MTDYTERLSELDRMHKAFCRDEELRTGRQRTVSWYSDTANAIRELIQNHEARGALLILVFAMKSEA